MGILYFRYIVTIIKICTGAAKEGQSLTPGRLTTFKFKTESKVSPPILEDEHMHLELPLINDI